MNEVQSQNRYETLVENLRVPCADVLGDLPWEGGDLVTDCLSLTPIVTPSERGLPV